MSYIIISNLAGNMKYKIYIVHDQYSLLTDAFG